MDMKAWYTSKAVWGGLIAVASGIAGIFGINVPEDVQADAANVIVGGIGVAGGALAVYGRIKADTQIGKQ